MRRERGFIPGVGMYAAIAAAVVIGGMGIALKLKGAALDRCEANYAQFVTEVRVKGEAAQQEADRETVRLTKAKESADANAKRLIGELNVVRKRLRDARSSRRLVPRVAETTGSADATRACFKRDELSAALRKFTGGIEKIVDDGDDHRIVANVARGWIRDALNIKERAPDPAR